MLHATLPPMPPRAARTDPLQLAASAIESAVGAALVLDAGMSVVLITEAARAILGGDVQRGSSAAEVICGKSPKRPLMRALQEGRAVEAVVPHPGPGGEGRTLKVRSIPLETEGARPHGFLVMLDEGYAPGGDPVSFQGMWSQASEMKALFHVIERVAPQAATVLVRGETGTGKELVAQALHALSPRRKGPFRAINCAALPANLLESELFGHVRGAFTGAVRDTPGHFQLATRGTLFLDEVGELPLELQSKLLRVLETRTVLPVGGRQPIPIDVRIVSATHRSLRKAVELGQFRADLMYRLRVIPIFLPPLRERREDVPLLAEKLLPGVCDGAVRRVERIAQPALAALERYDWPGNVRELLNVLAYACTIGEGPILQLRDLPREVIEASERTSRRDGQPAAARDDERPVASGQSDEARRIGDALARSGGNKQRAAELLGISRVTLWRHLRALQEEGR
jgi:transcriptional regulator with PAS, ATPase and Fis domain